MIMLTGSGFRSGAAVKLTGPGTGNISGTNVAFISRYRVDDTFNLTGKQTGARNVTLTNTDNKTTTLLNGFMVV